MSRATAASISVSSRSPTMIGLCAPVRSVDSRMSAGNGLPAVTSGCRPVARVTAAMNAPLPGARPIGVGMDVSGLVAIHGRPRPTAADACASSGHPIFGPNPCITATGASSIDVTGTRSRAVSACATPGPPMARIGCRPGPSSSRTTRAPACADVTTSAGAALTPKWTRCSATSWGVRDALFVTNARC
jgi:hypothetical protein